MGLYTYISDIDRVNMRNVKDKDIKPIFNEALIYDNSLLISEYEFVLKRGFFKIREKKIQVFTVYHECFDKNGKSLYEARQQLSASGSKEIVLTYLYGIINGGRLRNKE